jgi:hypothetical protein
MGQYSIPIDLRGRKKNLVSALVVLVLVVALSHLGITFSFWGFRNPFVDQSLKFIFSNLKSKCTKNRTKICISEHTEIGEFYRISMFPSEIFVPVLISPVSPAAAMAARVCVASAL